MPQPDATAAATYWSDALIFVGVIGGLFVFRVVMATVVFLWLLPDGDRCPHCNRDTFPVQSRGWNTLLPWFRTGWCPQCGWEGLHRRGRTRPTRVYPPVTR